MCSNWTVYAVQAKPFSTIVPTKQMIRHETSTTGRDDVEKRTKKGNGGVEPHRGRTNHSKNELKSVKEAGEGRYG